MSDIAINPVTRRVQFVGNTGTGPYAFTFNILQSSDIIVYKNNVLLTETTDYTVTIDANGTGNVTMVVALVATDILTMIGGRELSRTTDFVTAGDLLASSLNEQLDSNVIMSQQLDERFGRTIKAQPGDEDATLDLPLVADRVDKIMLFDTEGNLTAASASDFFTNSVLGGNYIINTATGNGSQTAFGLTSSPSVKTNIQVYIDGVYQNKATFSLSGSTLTFSEAPPLNAAIEFMMGEAVTQITGDASAITYNQGGTGAQDRTVKAKLQETVSVKDFGAVGDGVTDDTAAINAALAASDAVFFPVGTYLTTGNHNIKGKSVYGVPAANGRLSKIKLSGTNTNTSIFINGEDTSTPWGSGAQCGLAYLTLEGNWDGATNNTETNVSNIGALVKWFSGAHVKIEDCSLTKSFGFGFFFYKLGYSTISECFVTVCAKNGIHLEAPSGGDAITSTTVNNTVVQSCRGRSVDAATGGSGVYIKNGFYCDINGCTIEDVDDGVRIDGNDNRSISLFQDHIETVYVSCINYVGAGDDLMLFQNILATLPAFVQSDPAFQKYVAIGNFQLDDVYALPILSDGPNQVNINNSTPQTTIAEVTLPAGTWQITGNWNGTNASGTGSASDEQAYTISTSEAIPSYSGSYDDAVLLGDLVSPVNQFRCLQGSLSRVVTLTSSTTFYLYGGPTSISSTLTCSLAGTLKAVKVNGAYL